ncbi:MAG TPA: CNNM domain-containing protein [Candidatus Saccharimonadales bacterium]|nr:CNNM domain-containing protein [Candidatus Saccharimonadales bacterium]
MMDRNILLGLAVLLCAALSFLFSGMETGVLALNRFRVRQLVRTGQRRAAVLHRFLRNPENFLWTILVGNTVVNFIIFSLGAIQLHDWLGDRPLRLALAFVPAVFIFYIVCELAPKTLFQRYPNRLALSLALPFRVIHRILAPLVEVADWFSRGLQHWTGAKAFTGRLFGSRDELRFVMQESAPGLTSEEKTMINRVLDLPNLRVRHVMVPLVNTTLAPSSLPLRQVLALCRERRLTRVPVTDPATARINGLINLEHILYRDDVDPGKMARDYMQAPFFLPEELHLEEALRRMQHSGSRLAVVLGPNHFETGIVTLQDILKVIFGEVIL